MKKILAINYNKKIIISGLEDCFIEKQYVVRKRPNQYATMEIDGIKYIIFEDKNLEKYNTNHYTITGKKMTGGIYKNYFLSEISIGEIRNLLKDEEIKFVEDKETQGTKKFLSTDTMYLVLSKLTSKFKDHKKVFFNFVKKEYNINYN